MKTRQQLKKNGTRRLTIIPAMASPSYYFADNAAAIRSCVQFTGGGAYVDYINFYGPLTDQKTVSKELLHPLLG